MAAAASSAVGASKDALTGSIRWEVDKDSITKEASYSTSIDVGGMQWRIGVYKHEEQDVTNFGGFVNPNAGFGANPNIGFGGFGAAPPNNGFGPAPVNNGFGRAPPNNGFGEYRDDIHLGIHFHHVDEEDSTVQSFDALIEYKLINHNNDEKTIIKNNKYTERNLWRIDKFALWDTVIVAEEGFIKDNKLTVQVDFSVSNIISFRNIRLIDFTDPNEPTHDVVLIIEGKKIYVSKPILSVFSPVFLKMFNGDFKEKNDKEIELKDINADNFIELLNAIYPPFKKVTEENFEYLLDLSDRFEINMITNQAEKVLLDSLKLSLAAKLILAERYRLVVLKKHCLDKLTSISAVMDMNNSEDAENFSDAIRVALYNRIMTLPYE